MGTEWKVSFGIVVKPTLLFLAYFLLWGTCSVRADEPLSVSIVQLIANPEKYDGKFVRVLGYLHVMFEDSALYLSKDAADYLNGRDAVWVNYAKEIQLQPQKQLNYFNCHWVLLEGYFDSKEAGHMGMFSGGLKKVSRVMELTRWYDGEKVLQK